MAAEQSSEEPDPGGPVDASVEPQPFEDGYQPGTFTLMAPGWYPPEERITQSYGLCFTASGKVVIVAERDGFWNLPGGQVEPGERPFDALVREVAEEACARVVRASFLVAQHVWEPQARTGRTSHYQTRWWARVELDPWAPRHETVARQLVAPELVAPTLSWTGKAIVCRLIEFRACRRGARRGPGSRGAVTPPQDLQALIVEAAPLGQVHQAWTEAGSYPGRAKRGMPARTP